MTREPGRASMLEQVGFLRLGYQPSALDAACTIEVAPSTPISRALIRRWNDEHRAILLQQFAARGR